MDESLGLSVLIEYLDESGKSCMVKAAVALCFLVFVGSVRLQCLIALMMVLLSFSFLSSTRWRWSL